MQFSGNEFHGQQIYFSIRDTIMFISLYCVVSSEFEAVRTLLHVYIFWVGAQGGQRDMQREWLEWLQEHMYWASGAGRHLRTHSIQSEARRQIHYHPHLRAEQRSAGANQTI